MKAKRWPLLLLALPLVGIYFLVVIVRDSGPSASQFVAPPRRFGDHNEKEWENLLLKGDAYGRDRVPAELGRLGQDAEPMLPLLIRALNEQDLIRTRGIVGGRVAGIPEQVQKMQGWSKDGIDSSPRIGANPQQLEEAQRIQLALIDVFARIGAGAKPAMPELRRLYSFGAQDAPGKSALRAALAIDPQAPELEDVLIKALPYAAGDDLRLVAEAVKRRGPDTLNKAKTHMLRLGQYSGNNGMRVIAALGVDPYAFMAETLRGGDADSRLYAVVALANELGEKQILVRTLEPALRDKDHHVRGIAFRALAFRMPPEELAAGIKDPSAFVRQFVAEEMGKRPELAMRALPELREMVGDKNPYLAVRAIAALLALSPGKSGMDREAARSVLVKDVEDKDNALTAQALDCLRRLPPNEAQLTVLEAALDRPDAEVRRLACVNLALFGQAAKGTAPRIVALLRKSLNAGGSGEEKMRLDAVKALAAVAPDDPATTVVLIECFEDPNAARYAIEALLRIGASAVPELRKAVADKDARVVESALLTLGCFGDKAGDAVPDLIDRLRAQAEKQGTIDEKTAEALAWIGKPAAAALADGLRLQNPTARRAMALALSKMGPEAREVLPALERSLRDKEIAEPVRKAIRRASSGVESFDNLEEIQRIRYQFVPIGARERARRLFDVSQDTQLGRLDPKDRDRWDLETLMALRKLYPDAKDDIVNRLDAMIRLKRGK